jgi:hypothetical protein
VSDPVVQPEDVSSRWTKKLLLAAILATGLAVAAVATLPREPASEPSVTEAAVSTSLAPIRDPRRSAGPSPLEIAEAYFAHWDAGEVAAYEALVSPDANLFTQGAAGEVAIESWYRIATGAQLDRTCGLAGPNEVRCETTLVSGLQPGVVIADAKPVVLSVSDGVIVDFQFPDGFQTVYDDDIVGLTAYREWMAQNEPADFKQLFLFPKTIVVNSDEARSRHQEMIAKFLETGLTAS